MTNPILRLALVGGAALAAAGCATDGYGGYGYTDLSYGSDYGWYDDYYYPGSGYYVYERSGKRHRWSDSQRRHWQSRGGDHDHHDAGEGHHGRHHDGGHHDRDRGGHHRDGDHRRDNHDRNRGGDHHDRGDRHDGGGRHDSDSSAHHRH
jgi:hypothetical protein